MNNLFCKLDMSYWGDYDLYGTRYRTTTRPGGPHSNTSMLVTIALVLVGLVAIYYLYNFVTRTTSVKSTDILVQDTQGTLKMTNLPALPSIYEGGECAVSMWVYINSYNVNRNRRKHIFEIAGTSFSTLLIGLGAFKNTLIVRTHSKDFDGTILGTSTTPNPTQTPGSEEATRMDGSLRPSDLTSMFQPLALDDSLLDASPTCDLPEVDMQRWTFITVALSGRTIDVYLDGKLARSCVTKSYYKVDPTGVKAKLLEYGGFDGRISKVVVYNNGISSNDIYRVYKKGPN
jgi:hypothetical protein